MLSIDNVHDNTALQHASQTSLDGKVVLAILCAVAVCRGEFSRHCVKIAKDYFFAIERGRWLVRGREGEGQGELVVEQKVLV